MLLNNTYAPHKSIINITGDVPRNHPRTAHVLRLRIHLTGRYTDRRRRVTWETDHRKTLAWLTVLVFFTVIRHDHSLHRICDNDYPPPMHSSRRSGFEGGLPVHCRNTRRIHDPTAPAVACHRGFTPDGIHVVFSSRPYHGKLCRVRAASHHGDVFPHRLGRVRAGFFTSPHHACGRHADRWYARE